MFVTVLPNCVAPLIVQATLGFSDALLRGGRPRLPRPRRPAADARMGLDARRGARVPHRAPWVVTLPGLAILVTVVAINLLGDGLRDALDPS